MKIGSPFVKGSPESADNRAFIRALTGGASYFGTTLPKQSLHAVIQRGHGWTSGGQNM